VKLDSREIDACGVPVSEIVEMILLEFGATDELGSTGKVDPGDIGRLVGVRDAEIKEGLVMLGNLRLDVGAGGLEEDDDATSVGESMLEVC